VHLDNRVINGRQVVDRQLRVPHHAEQDAREREHGRHHGTADERDREIHGAALLRAEGAGEGDGDAAAGSSTRTLPPGVTARCPTVTTRSPAETPSRITTSPACNWPGF